METRETTEMQAIADEYAAEIVDRMNARHYQAACVLRRLNARGFATSAEVCDAVNAATAPYWTSNTERAT